MKTAILKKRRDRDMSVMRVFCDQPLREGRT
jgi:hypothetical protein